MHTFVSKCILIAGFLLVPTGAVSQSDLTEDELFEKAREVAFNEEDYEKARTFAYRALEQSPNYYEIRVFVGRTYAWKGEFREARNELEKVLDRDPGNCEALLALIDVEIWSGRHEKALEWTKKGLKSYSNNKEMMLARASAFEKLERYSEAEQMYRNTLDIYKNNKEARQGLRSARLKQMRYAATVSYRHDQFSGDFESWNIWQFELSRETSYGTIQGDIQHANMFGGNGLQFNMNVYLRIYEGLFAHVNAGYSDSEIFPQYRYGVSLFKSLPADYEVEAGFRRLEFSATPINIYTIALSKYWRSYLFTARSYLVPSTKGGSQSITVLARRYFADPSMYVSLMGGYGTGSGNIRFQEDISREKLWLTSIKGQYPLTERVHVGGETGFESEEFPNFKRDRFRVRLLLTYRF